MSTCLINFPLIILLSENNENPCIKIGFEVLTETSVGNVWVLYNKIIPKAISILDFKKSFVEILTEIKSSENLPASYDTSARNVH